MQANEPVQAPPPRGGMKNVSLILSVVAVVLGAAALGAAVAIPGPAGPAGSRGTNGTNGTTGSQGPQGPAGPGTLMAHFLELGSVVIGTGCTNASSAATLTVPSKGNVTLTASVSIQVTHTSGTEDYIPVYMSTSRFGGCSDSAAWVDVPASIGTGSYVYTVPVAITSPVAAAGTYTYTVGSLANSATASFYFVSGYAVFYPG